MKRKKDQMALHLMMLPGMILLAIFSFTPMFGIIMAFQNYMPARGRYSYGSGRSRNSV